jgi:putative acetyltransferase
MQITIRHAEPDDYKAIQRIYSQPGVVFGTMQLPFNSAQRFKERFEKTPPGSYQLLGCVDEDIVGQLMLFTNPNSPRRQHLGGLGMAVHDEWQGKGVGSALMAACTDLADNWLQLTRLQLEVYIDNVPAIGLYKKFGFEIEGTLRQYGFRNGILVDAYVMGRLRPEKH